MQRDKGVMPVVILTIICLITTALLATTNEVTKVARAEQVIATANANRQILFPEAETFPAIDLTDYLTAYPDLTGAFEATGAGDQVLGYLIEVAKRGYSDNVPLMVAIDPAGVIIGTKVLSNEETPGLGKKVADAAFIDQFTGQAAKDIFAVQSDSTGNNVTVDAVSGATISSRAVTEGINMACAFYRQLTGGDQ